jgi:hypothetical protein
VVVAPYWLLKSVPTVTLLLSTISTLASLKAFSILNGGSTFNVTSGNNVTVDTVLDNTGSATLTVDAATLTLDSLSTDYFATTNIQNGATLKANVVWSTNGGMLTIKNATVKTDDLWNTTGGTWSAPILSPRTIAMTLR